MAAQDVPETLPSALQHDPGVAATPASVVAPADLRTDDHEAVDEKTAEHEQAAHDKRNWVRLTFDCNNHCVFCLDSLTHDGRMRDREEVKRQILDGRRAGATRLILSGGEPTMHPNFADFVKLGRLAGYRKIQTITNGRLFGYPGFLKKCLDAGLNEITFSVHGPDAKIHDALVGAKGSFVQEMAAIRMALEDGRPVVNIDIVINRANVKHLARMLESFIALGVREFDLLQVIPFGNAYREGREILFYDLDENREHLRAAFEFSKRPDLHIWLNRFPIEHLEGFEHLIQDPYKLNDEVRGRREQYQELLGEAGLDLDCRDLEGRCRHCYMRPLCDTLYGLREAVLRGGFERVRFDTAWEAAQEPAFGGDPANARLRQAAREAGELPDVRTLPALKAFGSFEAAAKASGARRLQLVAPDLATARRALARFDAAEQVDLELGDPAGLAQALVEGRLDGRLVRSVVAHTAAQARELLEIPSDFEVIVLLGRETAPWLLALETAPARLALRQPARERVTEVLARDVEPRGFFEKFRHAVPVEGLPRCVVGREPRKIPSTLDLSTMDEQGRLEIFRFTKRYILEGFRAKSRRCRECALAADCDGLHVNQVRAHGFRILEPIRG